MKLFINGHVFDVASNTSLFELVEAQQAHPQSVAVVRNGTIAPRSSWHGIQCQPNDEIEIFSAVAGG